MSASAVDAAAVVRRYAELAEQCHAALTELDQRAGDGDFGDNLTGGLRDAVAAIDREGDAGANGFAVTGELFLDTVGGTSGPLLGLLFQAMGRQGDLADGVGAGLAAIQRVGEASVGDRTLVDALAPAARSLSEGGQLVEVADAAYAGARATAALRARHGRASYLGERAVGAPDPGAAGVALLFRALAEVGEPDRPLGWSTEALLA